MFRKLQITLLLITVCVLSINTTGRAAQSIKIHLAVLDKDKLQAVADQAVSAGLVGVSIAIYTPADGMVLLTSGESDRTTHAKLTPGDLSRIASCSKVFLGAVVLQLIQEGKIAPTDKISQYISAEDAQKIANADSATVAQLLSHTSGIFDYFNQLDANADIPDKPDLTLQDILKLTWDKPANFAPGSQYGYSNTNSVLLGVIVEKVTGQPFYEALRTRIIEPLGLKNTYNEVHKPASVNFIGGYAFGNDDTVRAIGDKRFGGGLPDGGLVSTPEDMAKFMRSLFGPDGTLLDKATVAQMVNPVMRVDDYTAMGYHIFLSEGKNGKFYVHNGSIAGYRSEMRYYPDSDVTIAMWTNTSGEKPAVIWGELTNTIAGMAVSPASN